MDSVFDLEGSLSFDYSELEDLQAEIDRRVKGIDSTANIDVDTKRVEDGLDKVAAKAKDVRQDLEKPIKVDAETTSAVRKLDEMRMAWQSKWTDAIDQIAERLSTMQTGGIAGAAEGMLTGRSGMILGGFAATAGAGLVGGIISDAVGAVRAEALMKKSTEQVFGAAADEYIAQAEKMADSTGYMTNQLLQAQVAINKAAMATGMMEAPNKEIQDFQKMLGVNVPAPVNPVQSLTRVATDIASTTGLPQYAYNIQAVTNALAAGLQGSTKALLDFNIRLDDTYVLGLAVNKSFRELGEAITPAQMAQARYNAILEQTASITGKASETSDDVTQSLMQFEESMQEAKVAVGQVFLPIVKNIADFIANIPKPLLEAGVWTGLAAGFALTVAGTVVGIKALIASIRELGATSVATAAENAGVGALTSGVKGLGGAALTTVGPLAALAAAVGGLTYYLEHIASETEDAIEQQEAAGERQTALMQQMIAKKTGMGDTTNPMQAKYVATEWKMIGGQLASFNIYGQRLSSEAEEWQRARRDKGREYLTNVRIQLEDRTSGGVQATDARSHAELIY